jgi:hypothetical protein
MKFGHNTLDFLVNFITYLEPPYSLDFNYIIVPLLTGILWVHILVVEVCKRSSQITSNITTFSSPNPHWIEKNVSWASTHIGKFKWQIGTTDAFNKMYISIKNEHKKKHHKDSRMHLGLHYATY